MKKAYFVLNENKDGYRYIESGISSYDELMAFVMALKLSEDILNMFGVSRVFDTDKDNIYVYSHDQIKEAANEDIRFGERYNEFYDKRFDEIPQLTITMANWEELEKKYAQLEKDKPQYLIVTSIKEGEYDKVDVFGKDELSEEDWMCIKQEHTKYLKYQKAKEKYIENHPDYSEVWRGPQDDEYEADIMKYYDQD